jgi:hypothetical protein
METPSTIMESPWRVNSIGLGLGLVFQRQQALLAGELSPRLQALGLLRKIQRAETASR